MSRNHYFVTDDGEKYSFENLANDNYHRGHTPGVDAAHKHLMGVASELFLKGETAKAEVIRDAANKMQSTLTKVFKTQAEEFAKKYPPIVGQVKGDIFELVRKAREQGTAELPAVMALCDAVESFFEAP